MKRIILALLLCFFAMPLAASFSIGGKLTILEGNACSGAAPGRSMLCLDPSSHAVTLSNNGSSFYQLLTTNSGLTLAGSQFANQGTATTLLHGNAAGNPSWGPVGINDVSGATGTGNFVFSSGATLSGITNLAEVAYGESVITATAGSTNDLAIGTASFIAFGGAPASAVTITGIAGGISGRSVTFWNSCGQTVTFTYQDAASSAANRTLTNSGVSVVMSATNGAATLMYSGAASRWVLVSHN